MFFFNDTATTEIYTLSLHDALPIYAVQPDIEAERKKRDEIEAGKECRSEERFSRNAETDLVCRLLLEKKKPISHSSGCPASTSTRPTSSMPSPTPSPLSRISASPSS